MNVNFVLAFSVSVAISILCNGDFINKPPRKLSKTENENEVVQLKYKSISYVHTDWTAPTSGEHASNIEMRLNRNKRETNETKTEIARRLAGTVETKNNSNAENNSNYTRHALLVENFKRLWPVQRWRELGYFTDDYLDLINEYWLTFPPPSVAVHKALGAFYLVFYSAGFLGNVVVLVMYLRCRTLRTPGNILVANLALSDFLMLSKTPIFIFNSFNYGPALGKSFCVLYGFVGGLTGTNSIATLAAIALDRYYAVVRPLEPLRSLTAVRARLFAVGSWLYAALFASIPAIDFGYGHYVPEGYLTSCSFDYLTEEVAPRYFIFAFFCAAWVAPFCTISFCYISILRVVIFDRNVASKKQEQRLSSRHIKEQAKRKAEVKLAGLVIVVIALFFISWTPYAIVSLLGIFGKKEIISPLGSMIPALFCKTAACINPFIYIMNHPTFRKEFRKIWNREASKRLSGGTIKSSGVTDMTRTKSKDLTDPDVEIVQMKDIPYQQYSPQKDDNVKTISSKVSESEGSRRSMSMKSFEENVVTPPSWYAKPKFAKKKSFRRRSTKSVISLNTEISI